MCTFRVEQNVGPDSMQAMLDAFFRDREVVSMKFLNKFEECGAVGHAGHIKGRIEED